METSYYSVGVVFSSSCINLWMSEVLPASGLPTTHTFILMTGFFIFVLCMICLSKL